MARDYKKEGYTQIAVRLHEQRDAEALRILRERPVHDTIVQALILFEKDEKRKARRRAQRAEKERERRALNRAETVAKLAHDAEERERREKVYRDFVEAE